MNEQFITEDILDELGIDLAGQDKAALLTHLNDTLQERIGVEITESLDDNRLQELLDLQESGSDDAISRWLKQNIPNLEEIVSDHTAVILGELAENADDIDATS